MVSVSWSRPCPVGSLQSKILAFSCPVIRSYQFFIGRLLGVLDIRRAMSSKSPKEGLISAQEGCSLHGVSQYIQSYVGTVGGLSGGIGLEVERGGDKPNRNSEDI